MIVHINPEDLAQAVKKIVAIPVQKSPDDRHRVAKLSLDTHDRGLIVTVSNPVTYAAVLCPGKIEQDSSSEPVLVDCARFIRMATTAKETITLSGETGKIKINSGGWDMSLTTPVKSIPEPSKESFTNVLRAPSRAIYHAVRAVTPAAATRDTRFHLTGMVIEFFDGQVYVASSDGVRMSAAKIGIKDMKGKPCQYIIPAKAANQMALFLGSDSDLSTIACDKNKVWAWNDAGYVVIVQIDGRFPKWTELLRSDDYQFCTVHRSVLIDAINHAALAIDTEDQEGEVNLGVDISVSTNELTASGESNIHGTSTWSVPVVYEGSELRFCLKFRSLLTALRAIPDDTVHIGARDSNSAIHIYGSASRWVIAPISHVEVSD